MTDNIGIGIIGTGFARRVQIPAFLACENVTIASVSSGNAENARLTAEEFKIDHHSGDWRETVLHPNVDLVCITTPPNLHCEMALAALEAGKHVLCEKPMAMDVSEAQRMCEAATGKNVFALIDHELRFLPGRQKAYGMLRDGVIGKVRHVKYNFRAPHRGDPELPWNWWSDIEAGGGALGAIGSHVIDSLNWFLGANILSISCQLQTHVRHRADDNKMREVTTDDEANMLLRFGDSNITEDATGLVSLSMVEQPEYLNRMEFFGTDGAIRVEHRGEIYLARNSESEWSKIEVEFAPGIEGVPETGFPSGFMAFAPKIIAAIRSGIHTIEHAATFIDGLAVQRVMDAARESDITGRHVAIK